jgi:signal transduction histidine kinase/ligand-binding sensor domain-containing protein
MARSGHHRMQQRHVALSLLVCVLASSRVEAAPNPEMRISQYAHTAWRVRDGFFSSVPHAIAQTTDGYVWIGTDAGLLRFDGLHFVSWSPPGDTPLPAQTVYGLLGARDGSLWIGTPRGPARWYQGKLTTFQSVVTGRVNAFTEDANGTVWMARSRLGQTGLGPLCGYDHGDIHCHGAADGIACTNAVAVAIDSRGRLWFGGSDAICRWSPGEAKNYLQDVLSQTGGLPGMTAIAIGPDGAVYAGSMRTGPRLGLQRFTGDAWASDVIPGIDGTTLAVSALLVDRGKTLWVGTESHGLYRVHDGRVDHFGSADGLSSDLVDSLFEDREGNLWVVTPAGLDRFRDFHVTTFSSREGSSVDRATSVLAARDGTLWIGGNGGLTTLRQGTFRAMSAANGLPGQTPTSTLEDHAGRLWIGLDGGLTVYADGRFRAVKRPDGGPLGIVLTMVEDAEHNVWASVTGAHEGLLRIQDFEVREEIPIARALWAKSLAADPRGGIWLGTYSGDLARYRAGTLERFTAQTGASPLPMTSVSVEADGSVWGANSHGAIRWQDGVVHTLGRKNGLPCEQTFSMLRDDRRALWMYMECGLVSIADAELQRWVKQPDTIVTVKTFDVFDGALPALATFSPMAAKGRDGRLWFVNETQVQMIDPNEQIDRAAAPPPVYVEQVIADRASYAPAHMLRLPPLTRDIEIDYTAPSFVIPEKVQFRYRLDGHDPDWQEPGARRQAFYSNLAPGTYRFRVIASNHEGVWNETGATLEFAIVPAYFQTTWFRAGTFLIAGSVLWGIYLLRLRQLTAVIQGRIEARLAERERIARELHDTLLQGTYGLVLSFQAVADRLPPQEAAARAMLEEALERADEAFAEGRNRVEGLRTRASDGTDLTRVFTEIGDELAQGSGTHLTVTVEGYPRALHSVVWDESYWIGREALLNAFHSADAKRVELDLMYGTRDLQLRVRDNGRGIPAEILEAGGRPGHWGIRGMRERAGRIGAHLEIASRPGLGSEVALRVPASIAYRRVAESRWSWLRWPFGRAASRAASQEKVQ